MLVNNSNDTKHLQIGGYYSNPQIQIDISYLLTGNSISFEVLVTEIIDNIVLYYSLNPDLEDLKKLEEKYCTVPNELFKNIYIGLFTQCFWGDEEIDKLRAKYILMGASKEEIIKILMNKFTTLGIEHVYELITGIKERADINKIWTMLGGC